MWDQIQDVLSQSWYQIMGGVANFLPRLLALFLIVAFTMVLAVLLRIGVRRFLRGIRFDQRIANWGFPEVATWSPDRSPTLLVTRVTYWSIVLLGLLVGISVLDAGLTSTLVIRVFDYLPDMLAAVLVLIVGTFAARFFARSVLISAVNLKIQSARLLSLGVKWLVLVLAAAMALQHLGIGGQIVTLSFGILFGGIVLALALAVGLGSKDMVSRSWEQQARAEETPEEQLTHL
jgi:hypothetical protein